MTDTEKISILLVDDDKFLADMYAMKFTKEGYDVHAFLSVTEALAALRGGFSPHVIMSDIVMPEYDGFFFFNALQKENLCPSALVVALTNQSSDEERAHAHELGVDTYIVKASMIPSEVVAAIRDSLQQHRK
jgi:DNA-binding response OmpR family regulator